MHKFKQFLYEMGLFDPTLSKEGTRHSIVSSPFPLKNPETIKRNIGDQISTYKPGGHGIFLKHGTSGTDPSSRIFSALNPKTHLVDMRVHGFLQDEDEYGNQAHEKILGNLGLSGRFKEEGKGDIRAPEFYHHLLTQGHVDKLFSDHVSPGGWATWKGLADLAHERGEIELWAHNTITNKRRRIGKLNDPTEVHIAPGRTGFDYTHSNANVILIAQRRRKPKLP